MAAAGAAGCGARISIRPIEIVTVEAAGSDSRASRRGISGQAGGEEMAADSGDVRPGVEADGRGGATSAPSRTNPESGGTAGSD